jgi:hypothetical protein
MEPGLESPVASPLPNHELTTGPMTPMSSTRERTRLKGKTLRWGGGFVSTWTTAERGLHRTANTGYSWSMPSISPVRRHVSFVEVIAGGVDAGTTGHTERSVVERLAASGIPIDAVEISGDGCSFIISSRDGGRFASAIRDLNVAVKFHGHCARVALTRAPMDWPLPALKSVIEALDTARIGIVHLTSDTTSMALVVDEAEADRVVGVLSRFYRPAATSAAATHSIAS